MGGIPHPVLADTEVGMSVIEAALTSTIEPKAGITVSWALGLAKGQIQWQVPRRMRSTRDSR